MCRHRDAIPNVILAGRQEGQVLCVCLNDKTFLFQLRQWLGGNTRRFQRLTMATVSENVTKAFFPIDLLSCCDLSDS
jgi:hypothetical protein